MKKRIMTIFLIFTIFVMIIVGHKPQKITKTKEEKNSSFISMMVENEDGEYVENKAIKFPTDKYLFNPDKSGCENGGILSWNAEKQKVQASLISSDKCYAYFELKEKGTEDRPYLIENIEDLVNLSNNVNKGTTYLGEYFLLTKDLDFTNPDDYEDADRRDYEDLNGVEGVETLINELTNSEGSGFIPIGNSYANSFQGTFDGNNKKITNIFINNSKQDSVGLFGYLKDAQIKNLRISGNIISHEIANMGGIAGTAYGNCLLRNLHNNVKLTCDEDMAKISMYIGGIIGYINENGTVTITDSSNEETILANSGTGVGGLIGATNIDVILTISNSFNKAKIEGNRATWIGGLIGYKKTNVNDNSATYVENCYNTGEIINNFNYTAGQIFCGGLVGATEAKLGDYISNSYNTGNVYGCNRVGGIAGHVGNGLILNQSYNKGDIAGNENGYMESSGQKIAAGGLFGTTGIVNILNSYNAGNVTSKYLLNGNESYSQGGGLIGFVQNNVNVINSYNKGDVLGSAGLLWMAGGIVNPSNGNNIFNIGKVNDNLRGRIATVSIYQSKSTFNAQNMYYWNESSSYTTEPNATPKTLLEMQSQAFVDELNHNTENINLETINPILKNYSLTKWKLDSNNYPTLNF